MANRHITIDRTLPAICAALVMAGCLPLLAHAQTEAAEESIIVTATRIERELDQVPAAVSVITQDTIQLARQQLAIDESLNRVPGMFMQNRYNFAQDLRVSIRGFGARANFGIRGIKILVDGIPETLPDGQGAVDSIDIGATGQIEVLRGPSSTLWGNAAGGVISVTSERAPDEPFTEVRLTGGEYDFRKVQLKTGAQRDRFGYLLSLSDAEMDGYREQSRFENTTLSGRFNIDLGDDRELISVLAYTDQPVSDDAGGINAAQAALDPRSARDVNITYDAGESLEQTRIGFVYRMPVGDGNEIVARNYYVTRDFENFLPFTGGGNVGLDRFFAGAGLTYEINGMLGDRENSLLVGFDVEDQDDDRRRYDNLNGVRGPLTFDQNESVSSMGLYVQNEFIVSETLAVTAGLRYDEVEFDVTDRFLSDGNDSGNVKLDDVSPMLGLSANLSDKLNFYATYSSAFETPTTTEFNRPDGAGGFNDSLKPQIAENLEVGLRGQLNRYGRYEIAVFTIDVDDELIPFEVPSSPGRDYFENAGQSTRNGIEFSISAQPTERLSTTFSYTYSDFEFDRFVDANGNDYAGNTIPGTAENVAFAEVIYSHPGGWFASLDALYVSEQFANNANTATSPSYTVSNLRFGWDIDPGTTTISPFVGINNLFDETYDANVRINAFGGRYYEPAPDRNVYAGVTVRFGG